MAFLTTDKCFFTKEEVLHKEEFNGYCFDGYYYAMKINGTMREFKLSSYDDWANDEWLSQHGREFIDLVELKNRWDFFSGGRKLQEVKALYHELKFAPIKFPSNNGN